MAADAPPVEVDDFEYLIAEEGVALVRIAGRWASDPGDPRPAFSLLVAAPAGAWRILPLPSWGQYSPDETAVGEEWRLGLRLNADLLGAETSFGLEVGPRFVLELAQPHVRGEPAGWERPVLGVRVSPAERIAQVEAELQAAQEAAESARERAASLEQRLEMAGAVDAQNRSLRARIAEVEDALARAQHAAAIASDLQRLIDAETAVAQARAELEAARGELRSGLFDSGGRTEEQLEELAARERDARSELDTRLEQLHAARGEIERMLPDEAEGASATVERPEV